MKVLLVDDSDGVRMTMSALLEDAGHEVTEASSLAAARALLGREVDVVVLDLNLTDGMGVELAAEVRRAHPRAAIVVLTGSDLAVERGDVDLVMRKAGNPEAIVKTLEEAAAAKTSRAT